MTAGDPGAVLVTGAASGIGRATALLAAERGHQVVAVDRDADGLARLAAEVTTGEVLTVVADVTDENQVGTAVTSTRAHRRPLTGAVSCAGVEVLGEVQELDPADWARCLAVNLTGTFNVVRAVLPELVGTRGAIVVMASDAGVTGAQGYAAYCAAKHGVVGLMKAVALDLGPRGVRINAVAPGFVETPMAERIFAGDDAGRRFYQGTVPLGRFAQPGEIARSVLHLLGDDASYVTGSVYRIDGGSTAGYFLATPEGQS